jgi:hypothetical protein
MSKTMPAWAAADVPRIELLALMDVLLMDILLD